MDTFWHLVQLLLLFAVSGNAVLLYLGWKWNTEQAKHDNWISQLYGDEAHLLPQRDIILHMSVNCSCNPKKYPTNLPDSKAQWQVVHQAQDGRKQL